MNTEGAVGKENIYLDCAILRPGDILLTADKSAVSTAIRAATGGPFSHAALIMERTVRLEADGSGTGYTPMFYERVEQLTNPRRGRFLHLLPAATLRAKVVRRPGLADSDPKLFYTLSDLAHPFLWKEYPELCNLAEVFHQEAVKRAAILPFLRVLDKYVKTKPTNPGLFCSELVAAIFERLGYPLFAGVRPDEIGPNAIASSPDLIELGEAITTPDESAELDEPKRELMNLTMRLPFSRQVLPGLAEFMAVVDRLQKQAEADHDA